VPFCCAATSFFRSIHRSRLDTARTGSGRHRKYALRDWHFFASNTWGEQAKVSGAYAMYEPAPNETAQMASMAAETSNSFLCSGRFSAINNEVVKNTGNAAIT
jgi:hypothetical protein